MTLAHCAVRPRCDGRDADEPAAQELGAQVGAAVSRGQAAPSTSFHDDLEDPGSGNWSSVDGWSAPRRAGSIPRTPTTSRLGRLLVLQWQDQLLRARPGQPLGPRHAYEQRRGAASRARTCASSMATPSTRTPSVATTEASSRSRLDGGPWRGVGTSFHPRWLQRHAGAKGTAIPLAGQARLHRQLAAAGPRRASTCRRSRVSASRCASAWLRRRSGRVAGTSTTCVIYSCASDSIGPPAR